MKRKAEELVKMCSERRTSAKDYFWMPSNKWHFVPEDRMSPVLEEIYNLASDINWEVCAAAGDTSVEMVAYDAELAGFAFNILNKVLDNGEPIAQASAILALGKISTEYYEKTRPIIPKLIALLDRYSWFVQMCAADALGVIGEKHPEEVSVAIPKLVGKLHDERLGVTVRTSAAIALCNMGIEEALEPLIKLRDEGNKRSSLVDGHKRPITLVFYGEDRPIDECMQKGIEKINQARLDREKKQIINMIDKILAEDE